MVHNFSAGPSVLPLAVLKTVQSELLDYGNSGSSILELSHRNPLFSQILKETKINLTKILCIPQSHAILFLQGGATAIFSAVYLNLAKNKQIDYIVTGTWSQKAAEEAARLGGNVNVVCKAHDGSHSDSEWRFSKEAGYVYYCGNETVCGVEVDEEDGFWDRLPKDVPVVCDMSSNILTKRLDVSKFGVIYAGAQKNMGPAGVTIVIIRKDLIPDTQSSSIPFSLCFKTFYDSDSLYNTPPTFAIYVTNLVLQDLLQKGGLEYSQSQCIIKSSKVYEAILRNSNKYQCLAKKNRSRVNITFRILADGKVSEEKEKEFLLKSEELGMRDLKGHRSFGGIRASLYNALPMESVDALVEFLDLFI